MNSVGYGRGEPEYKGAVALVQGVMEWVDSNYSEEKAREIVVGQIRGQLLKRIDGWQQEHIGEVVPEWLKPAFDKGVSEAKDKVIDMLVDQIQDAVLAKRMGKEVTVAYPYRQNAGISGAGQQAGESAKCTFFVTKYGNNTYRIRMEGNYEVDDKDKVLRNGTTLPG